MNLNMDRGCSSGGKSRVGLSCQRWAALILSLGVAAGAGAQQPIATMSSPTNHGGQVLLGSVNVFAGSASVARVGDLVVCQLQCAGSQQPHGGGTITTGSASVLVNGRPVARSGTSMVQESCDTSTISGGVATVLVGP